MTNSAAVKIMAIVDLGNKHLLSADDEAAICSGVKAPDEVELIMVHAASKLMAGSELAIRVVSTFSIHNETRNLI